MSDAAKIESIIGPFLPQADNSVMNRLRAGKTGELVVGDAHGRFFEAASRGKLYYACNQAAITFGTALTATAVTFTLYNPLGSLVNLVLLQTGVTVLTGTTAGSIVYAANVNPAAAIPATNTELTVRNAKLDGAAGYAKAYSITTLPAAPVAIRTIGGLLGATAGGVMNSIVDNVDGSIILAPNTCLTVQGITIVGTGLISMLWEEVPIQQ
jgi:hypothetical protein